MSSSTAQLDGNPVQLDLVAKDGNQPYDHISKILTLLHRTRGRDCPDHLWEPDKRYLAEMKRFWCAFLELRSAIRGRVLHLKAHALSRTYEGNPRLVIDQRGQLGSLDQAVTTYLRNLPPSLIPSGAAPRFLSPTDEELAQSEFRALSQSVGEYIPDFEQWQTGMMEDQKRDQDASNSLSRLCSLSRRFGNFTLRYRQSRLRPGEKSPSPRLDKSYSMGADIQQRVCEIVGLRRTVGPIERATLLLWFQRIVPEVLRLPLPGNVVHFLNEHNDVLDLADVEQGFQGIVGLVGLTGLNPRKLSRHIKGALDAKQSVPGPVRLALLKAFILSKDPINSCTNAEAVKEELTLPEKQLLRLTSEYEGDLRLLQAIQNQV